MIGPYLHANRRRKRVEHGVIFLIILAGNVGGSLLPIGDPPLYLGYLSGVPFFWTLTLWRPWIFVVGATLAVFFAWDLRRFRREGFEGEDETRSQRSGCMASSIFRSFRRRSLRPPCSAGRPDPPRSSHARQSPGARRPGTSGAPPTSFAPGRGDRGDLLASPER
jgi:hypothetical protein